jgi:catechol 2,3-dioxygenase-like lactoylglutathione lyase family enzyme
MSLIKIEDIAHVRFHAPDLAQMRQFLEDFGFSCFEDSGKLYGKGSDGRPFLHVTEPGEARFAALGLRATSLTDLKILATHEKVAVETSTAPGGGHIVRLTDPDGYVIEVVCDQASDAAGELPPEPIRNSAGTQARLRSLVRLDPGPSHIRRIGHAVLNVTDFRTGSLVQGALWFPDLGRSPVCARHGGGCVHAL